MTEVPKIGGTSIFCVTTLLGAGGRQKSSVCPTCDRREEGVIILSEYHSSFVSPVGWTAGTALKRFCMRQYGVASMRRELLNFLNPSGCSAHFAMPIELMQA
jgi:hypothetical protein